MPAAYSEILRAFLKEHSEELCGECRERSVLNPMRVFDCKVPRCKEVLQRAPRLSDHLCAACEQASPGASRNASAFRALLLCLIAVWFAHGLLHANHVRVPVVAAGSPVGSGRGRSLRWPHRRHRGAVGPRGRIRNGHRANHSGTFPVGRGNSGCTGPDRLPGGHDGTGRGEVFRLAHEIRKLGGSTELDYMARSAKGQMKQRARAERATLS